MTTATHGAPAVPDVAALRDRHRGQRCFVTGNAPSLARLDLPCLAGEVNFTVNRGYLAGPLGLPRAPYHVVADPDAYRTYGDELRRADLGLRLYRANVFDLPDHVEAADREPAVRYPFHMQPTMDEGHFAEDVGEGTYRGFTVVLEAVQWAFHMGCSPVYIIGCDLDYTGAASHFYEATPGELARLSVMPVPRALASMAVARRIFERHGRVLANAGVGELGGVLPRVPFASLF